MTNVVFVCDCSGSMAGPREKKMREAVRQMLGQLPTESYSTALVPFSSQPRPGLLQPPAKTLARVEELDTDSPGMGGQTALLDAMNSGLQMLFPSSGKRDPGLLVVITDGEENASWTTTVGALRSAFTAVAPLLTVTFVGPASAVKQMNSFIPELNARPWDADKEGLPADELGQAVKQYVSGRAAGQSRVTGLFTPQVGGLTVSGIRANTAVVPPERRTIQNVGSWHASRAISDYFGTMYVQGTHFYELLKPETIQDDKDIVLAVWVGPGSRELEYRIGSRSVRRLLGLPETGPVRVTPPSRDAEAVVQAIYVQSKAPNRKLVSGQRILTIKPA